MNRIQKLLSKGLIICFLVPGLSFSDIQKNNNGFMEYVYLIENIVSAEWIYQLKEQADRVLSNLQNLGADKIKEIVVFREETSQEDNIQTQPIYQVGFLDSSNECFIYNDTGNRVRKCKVEEKRNVSHFNMLGLIREAQAANSFETTWTGCEIAVAVGAVLGAIAIILATGGQVITVGAGIGAMVGTEFGIIAGIITGLISGIIVGADLGGLDGAFLGALFGSVTGGVLGSVAGAAVFAVVGAILAVGVGATTGAGIAYFFCED